MTEDRDQGQGPRLRVSRTNESGDANAAERKRLFACVACGAERPRALTREVDKLVRVVPLVPGVLASHALEHPVVCADRPSCYNLALQLPQSDPSWQVVR